ncbi:MAG: acyltransferase [Xanthobacteraceae bacterium]
MSKSSLALGNLRGFTILMVVAFHSFIAYLGSQPASAPPFDSPPYSWRANPIIDSDRWFGFDLFCAFEYIHLMQLMFFLSGLFVWSSLLRKGGKSFLYDRFLRLGVPFVVGLYLLMPLAYYPVYRVTAVDQSWSAFWTHWMALPFWPSGPMWFLWLLLALNMAAAGLHGLIPRSGEFLGRLSAGAGAHPERFFIALVSISALAYIPLSAVFEPWQWLQFGPFAFQPSLAPQYVVYFFAGLGVGTYGLERGLLGQDGMLARRWPFWLVGAAAAFLLWIIPTALIVNATEAAPAGLQPVADLGFVLSAASACFALAGVFLRFAAARRPILGSLSEHAYGIYLVHYVFVIWLQYILIGAPLFAVAKAAIVFTCSLVLSWATTAAVCRIPIGARLMGGKRSEWARAP